MSFFAYAKANPGKLNFVFAGANNLSHLGTRSCCSRTPA